MLFSLLEGLLDKHIFLYAFDKCLYEMTTHVRCLYIYY